MEAIHKQEYQLRDLPTRTVTLFPSRAQVVRDIKNVALKPGINQVTVIGLTPTTDEHSIKVDGTGSAIITDISVQLLPNQDIFEDIYPDSDEDSPKKDDIEEEPATDSDDVVRLCEEKKQLDAKIELLEDDLKRTAEVRANAADRLKILDRLGDKFEPKTGEEMSEIIRAYDAERQAIFQDHMGGHVRERQLQQQVSDAQTTLAKLERAIRRAREKASRAQREAEKARAKADALEGKRRAKKQQEKARLRREREKFWPRSCYAVCITLDATQYTPVSSRRSSVTSLTELVKPALEKPREIAAGEDEELVDPSCDLSISYVTSSACWCPCYDVQLNTTSATGTLMFDAELTNTTSESWKDCRVILSTSQAVFGGLQDAIPKLTPWRIKLSGKAGTNNGDITNSLEERQASNMRLHNNARQTNSPVIRTKLFGMSPEVKSFAPQANAPSLFGNLPANSNASERLSRNEQQPSATVAQRNGAQQAVGGLFGSRGPPAVASSFGAPVSSAPTSGALYGQSSSGLFGQSNAAATTNASPSSASVPSQDNKANHHGQAESMRSMKAPEPTPELSFQESAMEETGLTTTYDLPGTKTLAPSSTASKQRVARIALAGVAFSHTVVAKLRPAAFLQARLRNASRTALLRGPAGLTLDGTFLGRATLPRCSPGESFTLGLGVDPAVRVTYPGVDVRRRTNAGVFSTEDRNTYKRAVTIVNTRAAGEGGDSKAVRLKVIDQVPVSENETLKVELVHPRGLTVGGAEVSTGVPANDGPASKDEKKDGKDWGKALASMEAGGQINWDVTLNAGMGVTLALEYNVSLPTGHQASQVTAVE